MVIEEIQQVVWRNLQTIFKSAPSQHTDHLDQDLKMFNLFYLFNFVVWTLKIEELQQVGWHNLQTIFKSAAAQHTNHLWSLNDGMTCMWWDGLNMVSSSIRRACWSLQSSYSSQHQATIQSDSWVSMMWWHVCDEMAWTWFEDYPNPLDEILQSSISKPQS